MLRPWRRLAEDRYCTTAVLHNSRKAGETAAGGAAHVIAGTCMYSHVVRVPARGQMAVTNAGRLSAGTAG